MHKKLEIKNYFLKLILCAVLFCLSLQSAIAVDINPVYSIRIDEATIEKGYEVKGFEDKFQIAVFPYVLKIPARIELKNRTEIARSEYYRTLAATGNEAGEDVINEDVSNTDAISRVSTTTVDIVATSTHEAANRKPLIGENPDGWEINSDIYEFDVMDKNAFDGKKPFVIIIKYDDENLEEKAEGRKKIFYYDGVKNEWIGLPSTIMYEDKLVRAVIQLPYAKLAIFKNENILSIGKASWYKYKGCNCAASPDYPKGTKLKITAINSDKSVIVEVNDYGPERDKFPDRVIDLDLEAFIKIAKKGAGVIDVKVEPVDELCSYGFQKAKHPEKPAPEISAPIAVLIDEPTGEILYAKNEKEKHSIASITKLMTASVFLDMQHTIAPSADAGRDAINRVSTTVENWNKIIKYSKADDLEGAKLYVNDGETMTVKDIFYSMLVGSANNAAKTLVKNSGIEYSDFIQKMNEKAKKWHLENTEFKDPTGLNAGNVSAALDVAKMAKEIFKNLEMLKATTMSQYSFKTINTDKSHTIKTTNTLLDDKDLYITGAKTGFLNEAGHCLVVKAKNRNDGREAIGVVLGGDSSDTRFLDMKNLIKWALD